MFKLHCIKFSKKTPQKKRKEGRKGFAVSASFKVADGVLGLNYVFGNVIIQDFNNVIHPSHLQFESWITCYFLSGQLGEKMKTPEDSKHWDGFKSLIGMCTSFLG